MKETWEDRVFLACNKLFLLLLLALVLYPLIYIISASVSDPAAVNSGQMWLFPKNITFEGYQRVFQNKELWIGYRNTIFYTLVGTAINLFLTLPCAYALSRTDLAGRKQIMLILVFTMFFNGGLIPTYFLIKDLGMLNTIWAMLLPGAAGVWNIIVTRTYFQSTIPKELEEAAAIDGCSAFRMFLSVVLPLSAPIIAVMALFYGVGHWNAYFNGLIYLSNRNLFPLQLFLREILIQNEMADSMMSSGGDLALVARQAQIADIIKYAVMIVASLPILAVYPFLQRYFVKGMMVGSLKG
jgi:putative aldouronate transport system permease protein